MPLSKNEIDSLLKLIGQTEEFELNCEECLALVSEFAEAQLMGKSIPAGLEIVEQHLSICPECREEYEALLITLGDLSD